MNMLSLLAEERTASIREIQKNPSRALRGVTRVMRGSESLGLFLSNKVILENKDLFQANTRDAFKEPKNVKTIKMTAAQRKAFAKAEREYREGKSLTYEEFGRALGFAP